MNSDPWPTLVPDAVLAWRVPLAAALVTALATPLARRLAIHFGAVDQPGGRRIHKAETPRLGGTAILAGVTTGIAVGVGTGGLATATALPVLFVATLVCMLGVFDDTIHLSPGSKLLGLSIAAVMLIQSGIRIDVVVVPGVGNLELGLLAIPATIAWVLACTNAVNLIDGVDGLGSGVIMISAFAMMLVALGLGDAPGVVLFGATCGAAGGFLLHNRQPASIFLGDSGSLLLGFLMAATSAAGCTKGVTALTLIAALFALAVPFLDAVQSFVRRFRAAARRYRRATVVLALRATMVADHGHIHHRLLFRGMSHNRVALILCLVTTTTSMTTLLLLPGDVDPLATVAIVLVGAFVLFRVSTVKPRHPQHPAPPGGPQGMGEPRAPRPAEPRPAPRDAEKV